MTDNPPAFPQLSIESGKRDGHGDLIEPITASYGGATMRDLYAMAALQGLLSHYGAEGADSGAKIAFEYADQMLIERAKR